MNRLNPAHLALLLAFALSTVGVCAQQPSAVSNRAAGEPAALTEAPPPAQYYPDPDTEATADQRYGHAGPDTERQLSQVTLYVDHHPDDARASAQRAYLLSRMGRAEEALAEYEKTIARVPQDRHVRWSYGWSLFNLGDDRGALVQWREAERLHGGRPFWLPYTLALAYWALGEKATALAYYEAAARSYPLHWGNSEGARQVTRNWKPREKSMLEGILSARESQSAAP